MCRYLIVELMEKKYINYLAYFIFIKYEKQKGCIHIIFNKIQYIEYNLIKCITIPILRI